MLEYVLLQADGVLVRYVSRIVPTDEFDQDGLADYVISGMERRLVDDCGYLSTKRMLLTYQYDGLYEADGSVPLHDYDPAIVHFLNGPLSHKWYSDTEYLAAAMKQRLVVPTLTEYPYLRFEYSIERFRELTLAVWDRGAGKRRGE